MMLLGSLKPKPTLCYSNGSWIGGLNVGRLKKEVKETNTKLKPVRLGPIFSAHASYCKQACIQNYVCSEAITSRMESGDLMVLQT